MEYIPNPHIEEYRGYLECLSRLCANGYSFGVSSYNANLEIDLLASELIELWSAGDEYIVPSRYEYIGRERIEYEQIFIEVKSYIFNGLLSLGDLEKEDLKLSLTEDINEYYGLVSTSLNEHGVFHPLISNEVYRLNISCSKHEKSFYFIVKIENLYVLTSFVKNVAE